MGFIQTYPPLQDLLANADHVDVKAVDVSRPPTELALREFIAGLMSYNPGWIKGLYGIRAGFVRLLGMRQPKLSQPMGMQAADVPMQVGANAAFFTVTKAAEGQYWVAGARESHLTAYLGVVLEPQQTGSRFHVITIVHYNRWTGPVYFNGIRPFHHLVVRSMMQAGARQLQSVPERSLEHGNA